MNSYELSRNWFDFCFENTDRINPTHTALYFFAIEHCNRLGWLKKFGFPTEMAKNALGIKSYHTYIKTLNDLVEFGFIIMVEKSKNQYSSNIIALAKYDKALDKALDKAISNHVSKQLKSNDSIDKPLNSKTTEPNNADFDFFKFWSLYPKKVGSKENCEKIFNRLSNTDRQKIENTLSAFLSYKPFSEYIHPNPQTYLNQKRWNDEIPITNEHSVSEILKTKTNQLGKTAAFYESQEND